MKPEQLPSKRHDQLIMSPATVRPVPVGLQANQNLAVKKLLDMDPAGEWEDYAVGSRLTPPDNK